MIKKAGIGMDLSYIREQLGQAFSKIEITDGSINKEKTKDELEHYYEEKFSQLNDRFQYDCIDLFCGAGGLSVGLEQEGFRSIIAVDKDLAALQTYRFNRPWMNANSLIHEDIRKLVDKDIFPHVPLIVGGPPCQGFSVVNKHKKENDERNELYKFFVHAVDQAKPEVFLMENVEGILQLYNAIKDDFMQIGYITCEPLILTPKDFGFPQSRRRAFILGISERYTDIATELYETFRSVVLSYKCSTNFVLWDAIGDLPAIEAKTLKNSTYKESRKWGYTFGGFQETASTYARLVNKDLPETVPLLNHRCKFNNERDIEIFRLLKPGEKSNAESIQNLNPYKSRDGMFTDKFHKLPADEPCKTITAHMYYDCNMYIHPTQARGLSPREAARVQGFPDDYLFLGSPNEWYRQIGNAVSPLVARILGAALKTVLQRIGAE